MFLRSLPTMEELEKRMRPSWGWWFVHLFPPVFMMVCLIASVVMLEVRPVVFGIIFGLASAQMLNWDSSILFREAHYIAGKCCQDNVVWVCAPHTSPGESDLLLRLIPPTVFSRAAILVERCGCPWQGHSWDRATIEADGRVVMRSDCHNKVVIAYSLHDLASRLLDQNVREATSY